MDGQPATQPATTPQPTQAQPQAKSDSPKKPSEDVSKELIADLTVGLPKPFRLLHEALQLFRHKFANFFIVTCIPLLLVYILYRFYPTFIEMLPHPALGAILTAVVSIVGFALVTFGYLALLFAIKDNEENISFFEAYKRAAKHLKHFWRLIILAGIVVLAGLAALIVPGIIIGIWFSMGIFVYIIEDLHGMDALLQSKGYVEKYWIPVIGRWLFIGLWAAVFFLPYYIISLFSLSLVSEVVFLFTLLAVIPIISIFGFLIYGNLRLLRGDTTGYVNVLKASNSTKEKIGVLRSTFYKGALLGFPLVLLLLYTYVVRPFVVQGDSMSPSYTNNGIVMTSIHNKNAKDPERGDVVIFQSPIEPDKKLIKRIVGIPGETFSIQSGTIYINAKRLDERTYLSSNAKTTEGTFLKAGSVFTIPKRHLIVLGDNRSDSEDSREWGPIRTSDIIGTVNLCLLGCPKK